MFLQRYNIFKFWTLDTHSNVIAELGNCTFSPHFRNIIDIRSDCGRADKKMWWICSCGPSNFDFCASATLKRIRIQVLGAASLTKFFLSSRRPGFDSKEGILLLGPVRIEAKFCNFCSLQFRNRLRKCGYAIAKQLSYVTDCWKFFNCGYADMQLQSNIPLKNCGLEVDFCWKNCDCWNMQLRSNIRLKSCGCICSCGSPSFKLRKQTFNKIRICPPLLLWEEKKFALRRDFLYFLTREEEIRNTQAENKKERIWHFVLRILLLIPKLHDRTVI